MTRILSIFFFVVALLCFPSLRYGVMLDGADTTYYGFPLPWNSKFIAASLAKEIYLIPLAVDVAIFAMLAVVFLRFVSRLPRPSAIAVTGLLWAWGACCTAFIATVLFIAGDSIYLVWPSPGPSQVSGIHIGPGL